MYLSTSYKGTRICPKINNILGITTVNKYIYDCVVSHMKDAENKQYKSNKFLFLNLLLLPWHVCTTTCICQYSIWNRHKHHRDSSSLNKIHKIVITIKILNTRADRFEQTVKTLIILLLKEESDQVKLFVIPSAFLRCTEKIN